jgi:N12 class adenine-specific DNA methylase
MRIVEEVEEGKEVKERVNFTTDEHGLTQMRNGEDGGVSYRLGKCATEQRSLAALGMTS